MTAAIHVHAPPATSTQRRMLTCPVCRFRRRHVVQTFEYYDARVTCGGCGHAWNGEAPERAQAEVRAQRRAWVRCVWQAVRHPLEAERT